MFAVLLKRIARPLLLLAGLGGVGLLITTTAGAAPLPNTGAPAGFTLNSVATGFTLPTVATFTPDGRILVGQKNGVIKVVKNGTVLPTPFYTIPNVNTYVDRGLLGMTIDPNFATNGYVYFLYTYENNPGNDNNPKTGRLLRVTAQPNGDTAIAGSEQTILGSQVGTPAQPSCDNYPVNTDCIPADYFSHGPDTIQFGGDGKLYVSIGESASYNGIDTRAYRAFNLDSMAGKLLRINPDGTGLADNPHYNGNVNHIRSKVYASGFRNPFRFGIRPSDNKIIVGDVGWGDWEELNPIVAGGNYGWPCYEGSQQQDDYKTQTTCQQIYQNPPANLTLPKFTYPHPPGSALAAGFFYNGTNYPAAYQGKFFYGDYARNQVYTIAFDANNNVVPGSTQTFANNAGGPVAFFPGPNGDVYYVGIINGAIYRIEYSTTNQPPVAVAAADKTFGQPPLLVNFSSAGSFDPNADALTYSWNFGDGSLPSTEANPSHTYTTKGVYTATLTLKDSQNQTDTEQVQVFVGQEPPVLTITSPTDASTATDNQVINFAGTATDNGNPMSADKLNWKVTIQHCPLESCHAHEVLTTTGSGGQITFPAHEKPFYIEITLSASNAAGLSASKTVSVFPTGQKITRSVQFDGLNDYAIATKPDDFKLQTFTTEAWVKTLATDDEGAEVISHGDNWMVRVTPEGGLVFAWATGTGWTGADVDTVNVKDGVWHHVAVTKTATNVKFYVDGNKVGEAENAAPIAYVLGTNLYVGQHGNGNDKYNFNGAIDELRVWSAPRTDAEIAQYRTMTLPTSELTKLVGYYKADEGNGTNVVDNSANKTHPLTLVNGANWTAGAPLSDPPTPPALPQINSIQDAFAGSTIDTANKWSMLGTPNSRTTQNNTLNISPPANTINWFGVGSKQRYELKDNALTVEVPQVTTAGVAAETILGAELNPDNRIMMMHSKNGMVFRHRVNKVNSDTNLAYNAATMRWWRIREAANTIHFETSPDGSAWTTRRSVAKAFDLSTLRVTLTAGTYAAIANPGVAKFDNLNLPPQPAVNNAAVFNGANDSAAVNGGGVHNLQTFTVEAWTKIQNTTLIGSEILSNGDSYGLRAEPDGSVTFFMYKGAAVGWQGYNAWGGNLKDGAWHHIAVVKSATTLTIYIDGIARTVQPISGDISYTLGTNLVVGAHGNGSLAYNLTGSVDEVRLWNTARTSAQVTANMTKEVTAPQAGLVGYWQFNAASGTTALDLSGNNKPLTLTGTTAWGPGFPKQ